MVSPLRSTHVTAHGGVTRSEAEEAVRTLLRWAGDDPARTGLTETPARVVRSYEEFFRGYDEDPREHLNKTFDDVEGYDEIVLLRNIQFESYCEHHLVPILGVAHVGYLPKNRVVGLSKIARVVDGYAKRLQIQEALTKQIANAINEVLEPQGVCVVIEAEHECMSTRGVGKRGVLTTTSCMLGAFRESGPARAEVMALILGSRGR